MTVIVPTGAAAPGDGDRVGGPSAEAYFVPAPWEAAPRVRTRRLKACTVGADLVVILLAMAVSYRLKRPVPVTSPLGANTNGAIIAALSLPIWAIAFWHYRLYSARYLRSRVAEFRQIVRATVVGSGLIALAAFMVNVYVTREWVLVNLVLVVASVTAERELVRRAFARARRTGRLLRPVVIVGGNVEALAICSMLDNAPWLGYCVRGFVEDDDDIGSFLLPDRPVLGRLNDAVDVVRFLGATGVIIATTSVDVETSNRLTRRLTAAGVHVELSSSLCDIAPSRLFVRPLGRFPTVCVEPAIRDGWRANAKRAFDLVVALLVGLATLPVVLLAAVAIKLTSPGPVLFRQQRVGRNGKLFHVLKLRTMTANAEARLIDLVDRNEADGPLFKIRQDPRVTPVGRVLRAVSIDELPQLWNVVRGEMSLVGPRPAIPGEVVHWTPQLYHRLAVKPGITGMWQVNGRSSASFDEYVRLDLYYVDNWSLLADLAIMVKTIPVVLSRKGAC